MSRHPPWTSRLLLCRSAARRPSVWLLQRPIRVEQQQCERSSACRFLAAPWPAKYAEQRSLRAGSASNADANSTVSTGRADAYAATSLTASGLAEQGTGVEVAANFTDPVVDGEEVRSWGGFTFASGNEELRDAVNGALAEFKKTPEWAEMLTGYGFTQADVDGSSKHATAELCATEQ